MTRTPLSSAPATLVLKLGRQLEAHATGWGVLAVPLIVACLLAAGLLGLLLR